MSTLPFSVWSLTDSGKFFTGKHYDLRLLNKNVSESDSDDIEQKQTHRTGTRARTPRAGAAAGQRVAAAGTRVRSRRAVDARQRERVKTVNRQPVSRRQNKQVKGTDARDSGEQQADVQSSNTSYRNSWSDTKIAKLKEFVTKKYKHFFSNFCISKASKGLKCLVRIGKRIITLGNKTTKLSTKFLLVLLLMLSGDVECHPGPSTLETLIQSSGIKLFHQNIRGLLTNHPLIEKFIADHNSVNIVTLSETHIENGTVRDNYSLYQIPGFNF